MWTGTIPSEAITLGEYNRRTGWQLAVDPETGEREVRVNQVMSHQEGADNSTLSEMLEATVEWHATDQDIY